MPKPKIIQTGGRIIMIDNEWYRVPARMLQDTTLNLPDVAAFAIIADRADKEGYCTITAAEIAKMTGYSTKTIRRATEKLQEKHYIAITHNVGQASTYQQLILPPKRRGTAAKQNTSGNNVDKYKCVINNFDDLNRANIEGKQISEEDAMQMWENYNTGELMQKGAAK